MAADYGGFEDCSANGSGQAPPESCLRSGFQDTPPATGTFALHGRPVDVLSDDHLVQYSRARYYEPKHGRWLQRDPTGYTDGRNLYEAFVGNALANTDPMGTEIWVTADTVVLPRPGGRRYVVAHYYLNKNAFSKGIMAGLLSYHGTDTEFIGTRSYRLTGDLRHRRRIDTLIEVERRLLEQEVEANANVAAQELAIKFGITGAVAAPVAVGLAPVAGAAFSTTTIGITETTLAGNIAAASFTAGASLVVGETTSEALLGRTPAQVAEAGVRGFALGAATGAPFGALQPTGLTSAATARSIVPRSAPGGPRSITYPTKAGKYPSWRTVQQRYWGKGGAPCAKVRVRRGGRTEDIAVRKELHHKAGRATTDPHRIENLEELWPWEHAARDPHRHLGYDFIEFVE